MPEEMFTTVRRGYDPSEVERAVGQVQAEVADLRQRLEAAEAAAEQARNEAATSRDALVSREAQEPELPTYEHLGERVGQILALADAEAAEIRDRVLGEVETLRKEAEQEVGALRADADRYAEQTRRDADADGARILADARKAADGERDAAERDASARRAEAEERSTTMVAEARATADRVRAESERELAAAGQRRDSINAQLSNVRQMLATLSGTVPGVVGLSDEAAPIAGAPQGDPLAHAARDLHEPAEGGAEPAETEDGDDVPDPEAAPDVPQDRDQR
jgi:cell division septum initiation protein DivIVA